MTLEKTKQTPAGQFDILTDGADILEGCAKALSLALCVWADNQLFAASDSFSMWVRVSAASSSAARCGLLSRVFEGS